MAIKAKPLNKCDVCHKPVDKCQCLVGDVCAAPIVDDVGILEGVFDRIILQRVFCNAGEGTNCMPIAMEWQEFLDELVLNIPAPDPVPSVASQDMTDDDGVLPVCFIRLFEYISGAVVGFTDVDNLGDPYTPVGVVSIGCNP